MMLCAGPLGTIHGHINLTQYENICIECWLYINFKYSSTLRKIYILWIEICISLNLSVHFFFGNCSLRMTLIFITFSMSEQFYGHKFFKSWFCRTWVVTWYSVYVSGIAGRDLCKICARPLRQPISLNSSVSFVCMALTCFDTFEHLFSFSTRKYRSLNKNWTSTLNYQVSWHLWFLLCESKEGSFLFRAHRQLLNTWLFSWTTIKISTCGKSMKRKTLKCNHK